MAWKVSTSKFLYLLSSCRMSEAGVIGYVPSTTLVFASRPAATTPYAIAVLPETCRYSPAGSDALATS
ncbi:Uncharacterised protein [Mycobacteroides abscessus subsp. abscessus]|nr:Uncharacterised protein [Mycobacteroides abscessus subsp. abscessus]